MFLLFLVSLVVSDCNWQPGRCTGGESPLWAARNQVECDKECNKFSIENGVPVCCTWGWRSHPDEGSSCYVFKNSQRTYDGQSLKDRENRVCTMGSKENPAGLGYERISTGVICNGGSWLKGEATASKNQCAAYCETRNCNTFCWSDSSPEWDCLMYSSCKSIGRFNTGSSTKSYACYRKPHTATCYEACMERYDDGFQTGYIGGNSQIQKDCRSSCNMAGSETSVGQMLEVGVGGPNPAFADAPRERRYAADGNWKGTGRQAFIYIPPAVVGRCPDGTWVETNWRGGYSQTQRSSMDWTPIMAKGVCGGVFPSCYKKESPTGPNSSQVSLCCPHHPYTKKAKPCPKDKSHGCHKFANEWKKDGMCDLEDCGNCPSMWDGNTFDSGSCGDVPYAADTAETVAMHAAPTSEVSLPVKVFAAVGFTATLYGAFKHFTKQ